MFLSWGQGEGREDKNHKGRGTEKWNDGSNLFGEKKLLDQFCHNNWMLLPTVTSLSIDLQEGT